MDIALWDIAGKVFGLPVSQLLRGQYRTEIPLYVNTAGPKDWFDQGACRAWAQQIESHANGWKAVKMSFNRMLGKQLPADLIQSGRRTTMLRASVMKPIGKSYENCRAALDPAIDMIVHCPNEFDLPSAIGMANGAVHMMQPDILFAGGLSGSWKVADLGELF